MSAPRIPGGEMRRAPQRNSRRAAQPLAFVEPVWCTGDPVRWRDYAGSFLRDAAEGQAEIDIAGRVYRVTKSDLRPAPAAIT